MPTPDTVASLSSGLGNAALVRTMPGPASLVSEDQIMMLTDEQLQAEHEAIRAWVLTANHTDPSYPGIVAYLYRLEAVVARRNPQHRTRAVRQKAEEHQVRRLAQVSEALPPGVNLALVPFLSELVSGMRERLDQLPEMRKERALGRFAAMSPTEMAEFALGYLKGIALGVIGEVKGIVDLLKLPYTILKWITEQAVSAIRNWGTMSGRMQEVREKFAKAVSRVLEELGKFLRDPAEALKQLDALIDAMILSGLRKANQWGQEAVDKTLDFLEAPFSEVGEKVGHVVGVILFNVVMLVATDAIGNLVKEGASLAAKLAGTIVGKVGEGLRTIRSFLPKIIEVWNWLKERVLTFLADSAKLVTEALTSLGEALGGVEVAETAGPGGLRMAISTAEEAEETRVLMSTAEGKVPRGSTTTTVEELYGRGAPKLPDFVNQYVTNLRARFPRLSEANLRAIPRDLSQPGLYEEGMLTGSRAQLEADFAERKSGTIHFDDINEEGKIIDSKVRESGRQYGPREPQTDLPSEPDVYEQMTGGTPPRSRSWESALSRRMR